MSDHTCRKVRDIHRLIIWMSEEYLKLKASRTELTELPGFSLRTIFNRIGDRQKDVLTTADINRALRWPPRNPGGSRWTFPRTTSTCSSWKPRTATSRARKTTQSPTKSKACLTRMQHYLLISAHSNDLSRKTDTNDQDLTLKKFCQTVWQTCKTGLAVKSRAEKIGHDMTLESFSGVFALLSKGNEYAISITKLFDDILEDLEQSDIHKIRWFSIILRRGQSDKNPKMNSMLTKEHLASFFACNQQPLALPESELNASRRVASKSRDNSRRYGAQKKALTVRDVSSKRQKSSFKQSENAEYHQSNRSRSPENYSKHTSPRLVQSHRDHQPDFKVRTNELVNQMRESRIKLVDLGSKRHQRFLESQSLLNRYTPCKSGDTRQKRSELLEKIEMSISMIKKQVQDVSMSSYRRTIHFDNLNEDMDIQICYNESDEEDSQREASSHARKATESSARRLTEARNRDRQSEQLRHDSSGDSSLRKPAIIPTRAVAEVPGLFPRAEPADPTADLNKWQFLAKTGKSSDLESGLLSSRAGRELNADDICYTKSRGDLTERDPFRDSRQYCAEPARTREYNWAVDLPIEEVENLKLEYQTEDSKLFLEQNCDRFSEPGVGFGLANKVSEGHASKARADTLTKDGQSGNPEQMSSRQGLDSVGIPDFSSGLGLSMEKFLHLQGRKGAVDFTNDFISGLNFEKKQRGKLAHEPALDYVTKPSDDQDSESLRQRIPFTDRADCEGDAAEPCHFDSSAGGSGHSQDLNGHSIQESDSQRHREAYDSSDYPHHMNSNSEKAEVRNYCFDQDRRREDAGLARKEQETPEVEIRSLQDTKMLTRGSVSVDKPSSESIKIAHRNRLDDIILTENFVIEADRRSLAKADSRIGSYYTHPHYRHAEPIGASPAQAQRTNDAEFQPKVLSPVEPFPGSPCSSRLRTSSRGMNTSNRFNKTPVSLKRVSPLNLSLVIDTADVLLIREELTAIEERLQIGPSEAVQQFEATYLAAPPTRVIVLPQEVRTNVFDKTFLLQPEAIRMTTNSSFVRDLPQGPWGNNLQQQAEDAQDHEYHQDHTDSFSKFLNQSTRNLLNQTNQRLSFIHSSEQTEKAQSKEKRTEKPAEIKRALCSEFDQIIVEETSRTHNSYKHFEEIYEELSSSRKLNEERFQQLKQSSRLRVENLIAENERIGRVSDGKSNEHTFRERNCRHSSPRKVLGELKLHGQTNNKASEMKVETNMTGSIRNSYQKEMIHSKLEENFHNLMDLRGQLQAKALDNSERYFSNTKQSSHESPQKKTNRLGYSPIKQDRPTITVNRVNSLAQAGIDDSLHAGIRSIGKSKRKQREADLSSSKSPWTHLNETDMKEFDKENENRLNPSRLSATKNGDDSYFNDMSAVKDAIRDIEKGLVDRDYLLSNFKHSNLNRTGFSKFASKDKRDRYCTLNYASVVNQHQGQKKFSINERIYALENNIQLDESVSQAEFVRTCVQNSYLDRQERALKLAINESMLPDYHNELEDSPEKMSDLEQFGTLSSGSFEIPNDEDDPMKKNEFYVFFNFLVEIETECNRIRRMLEAHPSFNLASFLATVFLKLRLQSADGKPLLHKKQMFKLARLLGSKSSHKKFDNFWSYKFDKAAVNSQQFVDCFFNLRAVCFEEAEPASIKSYPQAVLSLLGMLVDLQVKKEIFFHKEKNHVSVMQIIDFIKRLTKEKREYLLFKDFPGSPWFAQYKPEDVLPIYKRFTTTELNQRINAYNICVILS